MKNVPKLRFKEFTNDWKFEKFKNLTKINQGLQIAISDRLTKKVEDSFFYITNEFLKEKSQKKYYIINPPKSVICTKEDVLMTRTGNTGQVVTNISGAFHNNFFKIKFNNKVINKDFLVFFLRFYKTQNLILRLAGTSTIPDLNHSDFYKIKMSFPSLDEQEKIANFLSKVDDKINLLEKKLELTYQFKKKTSMEVLVDNDWETKPLSELLDYEQPPKYITNNIEEVSQEYNIPVLTANKSFILGYTNDVKGIYDKGSVILFDDFTTLNKYVDFKFKVKSSAIKILTVKNKDVNLKFVYEAMQHIDFNPENHKRYYISEYQNLYIKIPDKMTQDKVVSDLDLFNNKIFLIENKLEKLRLFKKGLLQQMFV